MPILVKDTSLHALPMRTRMVFRYGGATLSKLPHLMLRATVMIDGKESVGIAADGLPPGWFTKRPGTSHADEIAAMLQVVQAACTHAGGLGAQPSVFDFYRTLQWRQAQTFRGTETPPLLYNFGVSLVERAVIDAFCKARYLPFFQAVRRNALGIRLGEIYPELAGREPASLLPAEPVKSMIVRHTVGLGDPLTRDQIAPDDLCDDGLPQALEACIQHYGLTHFKIKLSGDTEADLKRLTAVARVIETECRHFAFTLDGNEQFADVPTFCEFFRTLRRDVLLEPFMRGLLYVEQPWPRDIALSDATAGLLREWSDRPRIIIDESDDQTDTLARALVVGYAGTSHKNCKGVIKSIANACLIEHRNRQAVGDAGDAAMTGHPYVLSAEDLACVGPVSLLQDLAVAAALGLEHGERNGHHYFAGLSMWPQSVQRCVLEAHGDLYRNHEIAGMTFPTLGIRHGRIDLDSVLAAPLGVDFDPRSYPLA